MIRIIIPCNNKSILPLFSHHTLSILPYLIQKTTRKVSITNLQMSHWILAGARSEPKSLELHNAGLRDVSQTAAPVRSPCDSPRPDLWGRSSLAGLDRRLPRRKGRAINQPCASHSPAPPSVPLRGQPEVRGGGSSLSPTRRAAADTKLPLPGLDDPEGPLTHLPGAWPALPAGRAESRPRPV